MRHQPAPLVIAALALAVLPFALDVVGLPLRTSIDVVVFAIACMGLNVLVGHTGLVSFGHGAWFGLGAYAAALSQRYWFPGQIILPFLFAIFFVAAHAGADRAPVRHRLPLDRAHRRRERIGRRDPRNGTQPRSRIRPRLLLGRRGNRHGGVLPALALPPIAGRQRVGGDPRERGARPLRRLSDQPLQADRLYALGDGGGARRDVVGLQP